MPSGHVRIIPDSTFVQWQRSFEKLGRVPISQAAVREWEQTIEVMFDLTQQYAHVLSGDMVRSGKYQIDEVTKLEIKGSITYGGGQRSNTKPHWQHQEIDYTKYELERGGSHDFFKRAHQAAERRLEEGSKAALMAHLSSLRWR